MRTYKRWDRYGVENNTILFLELTTMPTIDIFTINLQLQATQKERSAGYLERENRHLALRIAFDLSAQASCINAKVRKQKLCPVDFSQEQTQAALVRFPPYEIVFS